MHKINMDFPWDEKKRIINLKKHGLDFRKARPVFDGPTFTFEDTRFDYGERRWVTLGYLGPEVVVIVHTETEEEIHVISMRKAEKSEQVLYFANL